MAVMYSKTLKGKNNPNYNNQWSIKLKKQMSIKKIMWHKKNEHPRGMLGKTHSKVFGKQQSRRVKGKHNPMYGKKRSSQWKKLASQRKKQLIATGWRPVGNSVPWTEKRKEEMKRRMIELADEEGVAFYQKRKAKRIFYKKHWMRSSWEARTAFVFDQIGVKWQYEQHLFKIKGKRYLPDFYIPSHDLWIEVRGTFYNDADAQKKTELFISSGKNLFVLSDDIFNNNEEFEAVLQCLSPK